MTTATAAPVVGTATATVAAEKAAAPTTATEATGTGIATTAEAAPTVAPTVAAKVSRASICPPFTESSAQEKVKIGQKLWNTRDPITIAKAYTPDSIWRNRDSFLQGHDAIVEFLTRKWEREAGYRLRKELFAFRDDKIAVQFWYEWHDEVGQWYRCYGLEDWTFATDGRMWKRQMSGNDVKISESERWFRDGVDVDEVEIGNQHW